MTLDGLQLLCKARNLSQSDLARMTGVSRQAVSKWFASPPQSSSIRGDHLLRLSQALGAKVDDLLTPFGALISQKEAATLHTSLLWDHLFPGLEDFAIALVRRNPRATARLVQVYGLFQAEKIAGKWIWIRFDQYKKFIHPARRTQCEKIKAIQMRHGLI